MVTNNPYKNLFVKIKIFENPCQSSRWKQKKVVTTTSLAIASGRYRCDHILGCSLSTQVYTRTMTKASLFPWHPWWGKSKIIFGRVNHHVPIAKSRRCSNMNLLPCRLAVSRRHTWTPLVARFVYHLSSPEKAQRQMGKKNILSFVLDVTKGARAKKKHGKTTKNRRKSHKMHKIPPPTPWNDERSKA